MTTGSAPLYAMLLGVRMALAGVLKSLDAALEMMSGQPSGQAYRTVTGQSSSLSFQDPSSENATEEQERAAEDRPVSKPDSRPDRRTGPPSGYGGLDRRDGLKSAMAAAWDGCGGTTINGISRGRISDCAPLLRRIAAEQGKDPVAVFTAAVARFKSDPSVIQKRLTLPVFLTQLEAWCAEVPDPEEDRSEQVRTLRVRLGEAMREVDMADTDAARSHWQRRAEEIEAQIDKLATRAA